MNFAIQNFICNFGIDFLVLYNKDFGRITRFGGNDLATVPSAAFCLDLLTRNSFVYKDTNFGTIIVEFLRKISNKKRVQIALSKNFKLWFQPSALRLYNQASIIICHF